MATNTTTASSSVVFSPEKLNFWLDNPSPISLTWDQVKHCREALTSLKDKFDHTPESITHEFKLLEVQLQFPLTYATSLYDTYIGTKEKRKSCFMFYVALTVMFSG